MQGAATVFQHPIHPMLVVFPLAFFIGSLAGDFLFLATKRPFWEKFAFALIGFGLIGGLAAAIPGLVDYYTAGLDPESRDYATDHLIANLVVMGLFLVNLALRWKRPGLWVKHPLSLVAVAVLLYSGYLGGHLVYMHHVGVAAHVHEHQAGEGHEAGSPHHEADKREADSPHHEADEQEADTHQPEADEHEADDHHHEGEGDDAAHHEHK